MNASEKKAIFARMNQRSERDRSIRALNKLAEDVRQEFELQGLKLPKFSTMLDERNFYTYIGMLKSSLQEATDQLIDMEKALENAEQKLKEAEQKVEEESRRVEELLKLLESEQEISSATKEQIEKLKAEMLERASREAKAKEKERARRAEREARSIEEKKAEYQKRIDSLNARMEALARLEAEAESAIEDKAATDAAADSIDAEQVSSHNTISFECNSAADGRTMPICVDALANSAQSSDVSCSTSNTDTDSSAVADCNAEGIASNDPDETSNNGASTADYGRYSELVSTIDEVIRLSDERYELIEGVHNPEDIAKIEELEEKKLQDEAKIAWLEKENDKLKQVNEERENDIAFQKNSDSATSSKPSRTRGYKDGESRPPLNYREQGMPGVEPASSDAANGEDGVNAETAASSAHEAGSTAGAGSQPSEGSSSSNPQSAAYDEAESDFNALHNANKSPNGKSKSKKRGKPKGAKGGGKQLNPNARVLTTEYCDPDECRKCANRKVCNKNLMRVNTRYVEEAVIEMVRQPYVQRKCYCPKEKKEVFGKFPEGVTSTIQYGKTLRIFAILLNTYGFVSYERTANLVNGLFGTTVSGPTVNNWVKAAAEKLGPVMEYIGESMLQQDVAYLDETGVRIQGVLHWIHTFSDAFYTYLYVDPKRGKEALIRGELLPFFNGTIVTDCWSSYFSWHNIKHGLCNAHLIRELYALVQFYPRDAGWASDLLDLMRRFDHERNEKKQRDETCFSKEELKKKRKEYLSFVFKGLDLHHLPHEKPEKAEKQTRKKKDDKSAESSTGTEVKTLSKAANLLIRLRDHMDEYLMFLENFDVEFSNANAEQSFRMVSKKRSVIGGFQTLNGANDWTTMWSYFDTCRKHKIGIYPAMEALFDGNAASLLFTRDDIEALEKSRAKRLSNPENKELLDAIQELKKKAKDYEDRLPEIREEKQAEKLEKQKKKNAARKAAAAQAAANAKASSSKTESAA